MGEQPELKASTPWNISFGDRPGRYDTSFDGQPMTPPGDVDFKEPPKFKPRRRSKYRDLLGEQIQIPERNEESGLNSDEKKISLSIVTSSKIPAGETLEQKPGKISTKMSEDQFFTHLEGSFESPHRGRDRTPSGDSFLQMLEKSSSVNRGQMRKSSSTSDLESFQSNLLKEMLSKKEDTMQKPHVHTEDCQPSQKSLETNSPMQRSVSSAEIIKRKSDMQASTPTSFQVIKTRFSASAEAARLARVIAEKNTQKSNQTPAAVPPKAEPELHKHGLFDIFNTSRVKVTNRDTNVWAPTSF